MMRQWCYNQDPAALFDTLSTRPWAVFLDSGPKANSDTSPCSGPGSGRSNDPGWGFQLLTSDPVCTLVARDGITTIDRGGMLTRSDQDPLDLLRDCLDELRPTMAETPDPTLPFSGGAIGSFGYELGARLAGIGGHDDRQYFPEMAVGIYNWALVIDRRQQRACLVGEPPAAIARRLLATLSQPQARRPSKSLAGKPFSTAAPPVADPDLPAYTTAFEHIQTYLRKGDCYQVNLARRFQARVSGAPWPAYLALRRHSPAPYGAYLATPFGELLCNSPEQFLQHRDNHVITRPIKGTRPRHRDPDRDRALATELSASPKDRAENVMIVDLLRNDLGKVCDPGSIRVTGLCELDSFATVHHLVSTIHGRLASNRGALDLLRATLPGGSITGAPKHRAMQIIRELEPHPREVYCGSIAALDWQGQLHANVAIRTLIHHRGEVRFWAGGGIVADSQVDAEYQETLDKAAAFTWLLSGR